MKNLFLAILLAILSFTPLHAQVILFSEDFSTASGSTPPFGWDQMIFAGDPAVDSWVFNNPGSRTLLAPLSSPVAIFDSDAYSNNTLAEDVALQSPVFSALGHSSIFLKFDHYFRDISPSAYNVEVFNGNGWISVLSGTASTANPQTELINVSAQLVNVPNARVRFRFEGNYSWYWFVDNIEVIATGTSDLRVSAIENLNSSCSFGTNEQVRVQIENLGTATQDSFDVSYRLNGALPVTEAYNGPAILPRTKRTYTFTATEDLSATGTYNIKAYTELSGDSDNSNDTLSQTFQNLGTSPQSLPYTENFDAFSTSNPAVFVNGWSNAGPNDWLARTLATPTSTTGPSNDNGTGNGIYLYTEATGQAPGDAFILRSPCIDISAPSFLSYFYHMYGDEMGSLELFVVGNGVATRVDSIGGQQQISSVLPWRESIINLDSFIGQTIFLEFRGSIGSGSNSDLAIDDVSIFFPSPKDLGFSARLEPRVDEDCFGSSETLSYELTNFGGDTLDLGQDTTILNLVLTGANTGTYQLQLDSGKVAPLQTFTATFQGIDLSAQGNTQLDVSLILPGDVQATNDVWTSSLLTEAPKALPFLEDFESFVVDTFGLFTGGWRNTGLGGRSWYANRGRTTTNSTGPINHNGPNNGVYLFTEATAPAVEGDQFRLQTPCIDFGTNASPQLSFFYHMYGIGMGRLDIYVVSGGTATLVDSIIGEQQSSIFDPFLERIVDLSSFSGLVRIEFRGTRGNTSQSDIAIDDVALRNVAIPDLSLEGAVNVNTPNSFGCFGTNESYTLSIKNNGATLDFGQDPTLLILEASGANSFRDTLSLGNGTINLREVQTFGFNGLDLSNPGTTLLNFYLGPGVDAAPQNDSLELEALTQEIISSFPYVEDFESGNGGFAPSGPRSTWTLGTPNKVRINGAFSGSQAWTTGGLGSDNYNSFERSEVYSPCFDMREADRDLFVVLYYWLDAETDFDGAVLESSTDGGQSWQAVGSFGDPNNWYNSNQIAAGPGNGQGLGWTGNGSQGTNGYVQAYHALDSSLIGQRDVRFRLAFAADGDFQYNGFAFDNFAISAFPRIDLGVEGSTLCIGESLDAGNPGSRYLWSTGDTTRGVVVPNTTGPR